ncbi:MAG: protein kinase, partial [Phycisphaerae bacterium]|nr:protein kinase [Phycisphaerae bacterium]
MKGDSLFGVDTQRLKKLAALGFGPDKSDRPDRDSVTTPGDMFVETSGDWIGHYKLISVLGEGGMGIVYLAQQQRPIRRQVALKLVKPGMDSGKIIARFEAEQQALACMDHPYVAHVYDAGLTAGGRPYFVMEYVEGIPITEHCDKHKLTVEKRLELFLQVCEAIAHAHQKGLIHRDIKPSNILVSCKENQTVTKVIDFGIAKALTQSLTERTLYTEQGQFVGTPEYMSPEQAEPTAQGIDTRTDIYSLGVVLYELLVGVLPFDTETFREGGPDHIRRVIREEDPKTPSTRLNRVSGDKSTKAASLRCTDRRTLNRTLHGDLDWITLKAMDKDPDRRYATAQALAEDIRHHLRHEPVTAGAPGLAYRLRKFLRRNRTRVFVAAAAVALVACITALTLMSSQASRQARVTATLRDRETLQGAQEALSERRLTDALKQVVPILDSESVGEQAQLLRANILVEGGYPQEAIENLTTLLDSEPEIAGIAHGLLARIFLEGSGAQADSLEQAAFHRQEAEKLLPETADAFYLRALTSLTVKETLQRLEKALTLDPRHYQSRRLHAYTLWASERYPDMEADALALIVSRHRDSLGYFLSATARFEQGKYEPALQETEHALKMTALESGRHLQLLDLQCRTLLALGLYQRVITEADAGLKRFPEARVLAFHRFCALLHLGDYDLASQMFYRHCLDNGQANMDFLNWGVKYVFDRQAAGQTWHHKEKPPEALPFMHMHEAEDNYRALASKGKRLINKGFAPTWSPDGNKLAYARGVLGVSGVAVYDVKTQQSELLIVPGKDPRWSPDGQHVIFERGRRVLDIASLPAVERRR